jgi:hypothetical protein
MEEHTEVAWFKKLDVIKSVILFKRVNAPCIQSVQVTLAVKPNCASSRRLLVLFRLKSKLPTEDWIRPSSVVMHIAGLPLVELLVL